MPRPPVTVLAAAIGLTLSASIVAAATVSPDHDRAGAGRPIVFHQPAPAAPPSPTPPPSPSPAPPAEVALHEDASYVEKSADPAELSFSQIALTDTGVVFTDPGLHTTAIRMLTTATKAVSTVATSLEPISSLDADGDRIVWSTQASTGGVWAVHALQLDHGAATTIASGTGDQLAPDVQVRKGTLAYIRFADKAASLHLRSLDGSLKPYDVADCGCFGSALSSTPSVANPYSDGVGVFNLITGGRHLYPSHDVKAIGLSTSHVTWISGSDDEHLTVSSADLFSHKVTVLETSVDRLNVGFGAADEVGVGTGFAAWVEHRGLVVHAVPSARETVLLDSGADPVFSVRDHRVAYIGRTNTNQAEIKVVTVSP